MEVQICVSFDDISEICQPFSHLEIFLNPDIAKNQEFSKSILILVPKIEILLNLKCMVC